MHPSPVHKGALIGARSTDVLGRPGREGKREGFGVAAQPLFDSSCDSVLLSVTMATKARGDSTMPTNSPESPDAIELQNIEQSVGHSPHDDSVENDYPSKWKLVFITLGLSLSIFLAALDSTIIAQAIPALTGRWTSTLRIIQRD